MFARAVKYYNVHKPPLLYYIPFPGIVARKKYQTVPSHLVLGGALEFIWGGKYCKDELYLLFVPITTGPCRTGQYCIFYENLFRDMREIMKYTQEHFVNLELNSEIVVSSGSAAAAMEAGYSGIVNISPFACLIGRVIEGLFTPWARERNYPILSVEVDGNLLPPNIVNKLNIFMVNVLRFKGEGDLSGLVDGVES